MLDPKFKEPPETVKIEPRLVKVAPERLTVAPLTTVAPAVYPPEIDTAPEENSKVPVPVNAARLPKVCPPVNFNSPGAVAL